MTYVNKYTDRERAMKRERYHKNKVLVAQLKQEKGGACETCGSTERLEFDHLDRSTKLFALGQACLRAEEAIRIEAAKCRLLCRRCHWKHTRTQHASGDIQTKRTVEASIGMPKTCRKCGTAKDKSEFYKDPRATGGRQHVCKDCESARARALLDAGRKYINSQKISCCDCGAVDGLEFDHVRGKKRRGVAMMAGYRRALIDEEIAKCEVVCTPCHMKRTERRPSTGGRPPKK